MTAPSPHADSLYWVIVIVAAGVMLWVLYLRGDQPKPQDCNTITHTRPFDGAPCIQPRYGKGYDRSRPQ